MENLWKDNRIQFARLVAEIGMMGLTPSQVARLKESMDLTEEAMGQLFDRAIKEFEQIKKNVCSLRCANRKGGYAS